MPDTFLFHACVQRNEVVQKHQVATSGALVMLNCDKSSLLSRVCLMKITWFWLLRPGFPEDELDISLQSASFLTALSVTFSIQVALTLKN